jgi:hypothetical protein
MDKPEGGADIPASATRADIAPVPTPAPPVPAPAAAPQPQGQYSPDGRWWWNGTEWVPVPGAVAPGPEACMVCAGVPAARITLRSVVAFVVMGVTSTQRGVYCRDCGLAMFRKRMSATLLTGWWGIIHFFVNIGAIVTNLSARSQLMRLAPPTRDPSASFLSPGRPVFLRPGFLVTAGVAVVLVIFFTIGVIAAAKPFPAADQAYIGACAQKVGTEWNITDCAATHNGKVVSLSHDASGCPSQDTPVKLDDGNFTCIDTSQ